MIERVNKLLERCEQDALDCALLLNPNNIRYFSGFTGEGLALCNRKQRIIITDSRYTEQAQKQCPDFEVRESKPGRQDELLLHSLQNMRAHRIYIEQDFLPVGDFNRLLQCLPGMELVPAEDYGVWIRSVKDASEIELLREACKITDEAYQHALSIAKIGMSEKQLSAELVYWFASRYDAAPSFDFIVASGENGSMPHALASKRQFQKGDLVTLDFGGDIQGYKADMTRTFAIGQPNDKLIEIYNVVRKAQSVSQEALKPGLSGRDAHNIAADIIAQAGYGEYFGHGLGHGVGLQIHELPRLSSRSEAILQPNMAVTCEPGIYLPSVGGVRIENTCIITENGCESLFKSTTEMIIL